MAEANNLTAKKYIRHMKLEKPDDLEYTVDISTPKAKRKFIERCKRTIRRSLEYKDYIKFLKENVGLDSCIFWNNILSGSKKKRISIQMHHEPFTLEDYVRVVLKKYEAEGLEIDEFDIAEEVMQIHYDNMVGLVPVSKTAHQLIHNTEKLFVPLNMVYGEYNRFLTQYDECIEMLSNEEDYDLYAKLERKLEQTANMTDESFAAIKKQFTYLEVKGQSDLEKVQMLGKKKEAA